MRISDWSSDVCSSDLGSKILVEDPSYLGALQSFSLYQPQYVPVPTDDGGLIPEAITPELAAGARFLYALPNFQNPTGRTLNLARRQAPVQQIGRASCRERVCQYV